MSELLLITSPNNNCPERSYAIDIMFHELFGLGKNNYRIQFDDSASSYILNYGENKTIEIEDHFFNFYKDPLFYINKDAIPQKSIYFHAEGFELPIIYGRDFYNKKENKVEIGLDIFASIFFMLTRWEESLLGREERGDCDEKQLFTVKHNLHLRAIVHEYESFLKHLLPDSFYTNKRKYHVVLSHDVDGIITPTWIGIIKKALKQTIHGYPKNRILNLTWKEEIKYKLSFPNEFSQFQKYLSIAKQFDIPEWFYIKVCKPGEIEATYDPDDRRTRNVIHQLLAIKNPQITIGFHPSQSTFENKIQWEKECKRFKKIYDNNITIGRNHHLLYNQQTLRDWNKITSNDYLHLSNCTFHKLLGFRNGISVPYPIFDIFHRNVLKVIEHPCQIMDTAIRYCKKTDSEIWNDINRIIKTSKDHNSELVLTWHIYIRNSILIKKYFNWCINILHNAK